MSNSPNPLSRLGNLPQIKKEKFGNGVRGNMDTVSFMKKIARKYAGNSEVRRLAEEIINSNGIKSHDHTQEALAIGEFVQKNCRYLKDPLQIEQLQEPTLMIKRMKEGTCRGDCDDMSLMIATLLLSIGIQPYYCIIKYRPQLNGFQHIYVCVYENDYRQKGKTRIVLDAIVKDQFIGHEVSHAVIKEFKV